MKRRRLSGAQRRYLTAQPSARKRRALRNAVRARDGGDCWMCGTPMIFDRAAIGASEPMSATLEHVVDFRDGGRWELSNLRLTHRVCNQRRGNSANALRMALRRVQARAVPMVGWPALPAEVLADA